jgi:hypothetical protein
VASEREYGLKSDILLCKCDKYGNIRKLIRILEFTECGRIAFVVLKEILWFSNGNESNVFTQESGFFCSS